MALEDARDDDPIAGSLVGSNAVLCHLSPKHLLALREGVPVVLERLDVEPGGLSDLQQHAEATANLTHPHLAKVFNCETVELGTYWVTEHLSGATLKELRAACKKAGKSVPYGLAFAVIHEAALALGELHGRRRSHGDVRDSNLFVSFAGSAKVLNPGVLDSLHRLPPDPQTDVFALAGLLYELLTGTGAAGPAFPLPSSFNHALEKPIDELMLRALGPDRGRRFKNASEFAQALKSAAGAYMWKTAQRADFTLTLFRKRQQREKLLLHQAPARLKELREARAVERAAAEEAAKRSAFVAAAATPSLVPSVSSEPAASAPDEELPVVVGTREVEPSEPYSVPKRAVLIGAAALAGIVGTVWLVGALQSLGAAGASVAVIAPPIPVLVPMTAPPATTPPDSAVAATEPAATPEKMAEKMAIASARADEAVATPQPNGTPGPDKPVVKKHKAKHSDDSGDAPLPPWLMRKGRR